MEFTLLNGNHYADDDVIAHVLRGGQDRYLTPRRGTTFLAVADGSIHVENMFALAPGMFAALPGVWSLALARTTALVVTVKTYDLGMSLAGGPIGSAGRLRYIDGCSDTGLIGPLRLGDPCLNFLHFPPGIVQSAHTHPSLRIGLVVRGRGLCATPHKPPMPMLPGDVFLIPTGAVHAFSTKDDPLDIIAFHPDSVFGPSDEHHQMLDATIPA